MSSLASAVAPVGRLFGSVAGRLRDLRASPALSPTLYEERRWARNGGHRVHASHTPHMRAAVEWLCRAQDATGSGGIARGFSLTWNPYFRRAGWQPAYPETTGYIVPTLFTAARRLGWPQLAGRAQAAARWEIEVRLPGGAVQGGVIGQTRSPAAFNTGQVLLGWIAAWEETGDVAFADAAVAAGRYLARELPGGSADRAGGSRFARGDALLYNARTAWALAEAGVRFGERRFTDTARTYLAAVAARQHDNGWLPACCLYDPERPLLHTLAYGIRGLLEGGRVLGEPRFLHHAERAARNLATAVREDGWLAGKFDATWQPAASWSCLTGSAQVANIWLRLFEVTGDRAWLEPVASVLRWLKATQNGSSASPGLRGGIRGSEPVDGEYGRFEVLSWATKFFADALMRHDAVLQPDGYAPAVSPLA